MTDQMTRTSLAGFAGEVLIDVGALAGTSSITYGVWQVYHPAAFIVGGMFALVAAWMAARRAGVR